MARRARKVRCIETGVVYNSYNKAGKAIGVDPTSIRLVALGKQESTKGLHFEIVEENTKDGEEYSLAVTNEQEVERLPLTVQNEQEEEVLTSTVQNEQGETIPVIDSREVARMMGKSHREILRYIDGSNTVVSIAECLTKQGALLTDYFIASSFTLNNRKYKCYLVTKKGCELLGNKQQGEKGILFSIAYVERFNAMEKELKSKSVHKYPDLAREDELILSVVKGATPLDRATALQEYTALITDKATAPLKAELEEQQAELKQSKSELTEKTGFIDDINDCFTFTQVKQFNKQLLRDRKDIVLSTAKLNEVAAELGIPVNKIDNPIEYSPYRRVNAYPRKVWLTAYPDIKLPEKESK